MTSKTAIKAIASFIKKEYKANERIGTKIIEPDPDINWAPNRLLFFTGNAIIKLDNNADGSASTMRELLKEVPVLAEINKTYWAKMELKDSPDSIKRLWDDVMAGIKEKNDYEVEITPVTIRHHKKKKIEGTVYKYEGGMATIDSKLANLLALTKAPVFMSKTTGFQGALYSIGNGMTIIAIGFAPGFSDELMAEITGLLTHKFK